MRRCKSNSCKIKAFKRAFSIDLPIVSILNSPKREWNIIAKKNKRIASVNNDFDWSKVKLKNYLFTHASIVCSVSTESNGYYIKPACSELINANGNAWTTPVLLATFRSFVGSENYNEHIQIPSLSKGKIFDAVIREATHTNKYGSEKILICDILVGTERKHKSIVSRIVSGKLNTMSMGGIASKVQCSRCGSVIDDNTDPCDHLKNDINTYFIDENGVNRIVSELCGVSKKVDDKWVGDPKSWEFIEASWVENPAFRGAVINHFISNIDKKTFSHLTKERKALENVFNFSQVRVANKSSQMIFRVAQKEYDRLMGGKELNLKTRRGRL